MIVGIITEININILLEKVNSIKNVDIFEWRLDYLSEININHIKKIKQTLKKPLIFTLRPENQGGHYKGTETQRLTLLKQLSNLLPEYLDIEHTVDPRFIEAIKNQHPTIKIIRSYHNFEETPHSLPNILSAMEHPDISIYKVITYANNLFDNFTVLRLVKDQTRTINIVAHCMGPIGLLSRVLGAIVGNYFHYGALPQSNAPIPYCPEVNTLAKTYHMNQLNLQTKIFALLGDPVEHSVGHIFHNKHFAEKSRNAVYVKIPLKQNQLKEFFQVIRDFLFKGFSITMPLKETIMPYLAVIDEEAKAMGAVNTLFLRDGQWHGTNTDGIGALTPIKKIQDLKKKHVLIIGAGGAAKAITHIYSKEPIASLTLLNRTLDKAHTLAEKYNGQGYDYETFKQKETKPPFDVVINAIPNAMANEAMVHDAVISHINPHTLVMDVDYGHPPSLLVEKAKAMGCTVIPPQTMYEAQALEQIHHWFET